jgi:hypothetical protein
MTLKFNVLGKTGPVTCQVRNRSGWRRAFDVEVIRDGAIVTTDVSPDIDLVRVSVARALIARERASTSVAQTYVRRTVRTAHRVTSVSIGSPARCAL